MIRRPPRSTHCISSAASDVYKRQVLTSSPSSCPSYKPSPADRRVPRPQEALYKSLAFRPLTTVPALTAVALYKLHAGPMHTTSAPTSAKSVKSLAPGSLNITSAPTSAKSVKFLAPGKRNGTSSPALAVAPYKLPAGSLHNTSTPAPALAPYKTIAELRIGLPAPPAGAPYKLPVETPASPEEAYPNSPQRPTSAGSIYTFG